MAISENPAVGVRRALWRQLNSDKPPLRQSYTLQIKSQNLELQGAYSPPFSAEHGWLARLWPTMQRQSSSVRASGQSTLARTIVAERPYSVYLDL